MKILHIFSNWKWTGPAEHALNLALQLRQHGHDVTFACAPPPAGIQESLQAVAVERGMKPVTQFHLSKHIHVFRNLKDIAALRRFIKKERFDIVHTHMPNDHLVAGTAARSLFSRIPVIRSCYEGDGVQGGMRTRMTLSLMTDGLITISDLTRNQMIARRYLPADRIWKVDVPVDLERFNPDRVRNNRAKFNLQPEAAVGGIVARVQKHRRFEVILEAMQMVMKEVPFFKLMVIGRGTNIQEIAVKPSQNMGIRTNMIFTGYKKEDYAETLACLNFKVFLMPGTDGACRAVREAMALKIPVIAARRGMLPEIIQNEVDGLIIDDTPENLYHAILYMIEHPDHRLMMGENAARKAQLHFNLGIQTQRVEEIYRDVIARKQVKKKS
jgi:glycosyltransferase involved in cell wall biosynthesis